MKVLSVALISLSLLSAPIGQSFAQDLSKQDVVRIKVVPTLNPNANRCGDSARVENQIVSKGYKDSRGVFHQTESFGRAVATAVPEGSRGCGR